MVGESLFDFKGSPKSIEALSEVVREASTIYYGGFVSREYRRPSRIRQYAELDQKLLLLDDLEWLAPPKRREEARKSVERKIDDLRTALGDTSDWGNVKPLRLRHSLRQILSYQPEDQVITVGSRISIQDLQKALAEHGQCLPFAEAGFYSRISSLWTVEESLAMNLPHNLEAQCGNWRDWVLGMKVILPDGTVVTCGSRAVKNVAGYDLQKLIIGSRQTLGIIAEVTLRTLPVAARPSPNVQEFPENRKEKWPRAEPLWIQRTLRTDFPEAIKAAEGKLLEVDPASCTLWARVDANNDLPRFADDWVLRTKCGERNVQFTNPTYLEFMKRIKQVFDPTNKLNPGEFGF